jgi:antitoxin ParD1/3/4
MSVKTKSLTKNPTIHISLTPNLAEFVDELVASGLYSNASDVIRESLREKYQQNQQKSQKAKKLREALQVGLDQARRGEFTETSIEEMIQRVKNRK